jgi:hypothetical protein
VTPAATPAVIPTAVPTVAAAPGKQQEDKAKDKAKDKETSKPEDVAATYEAALERYGAVLKVEAYSDGKGGVAPEKFARSEQAVKILESFTAAAKKRVPDMKEGETEEAQAFWINYFNAVILQSEVRLLKDNKKKEIPKIIAGEEPRSLWKLTAEAFSGDTEPWYLFALHTGRAGDPGIRSELYSAKEKELDTQLHQQTKAFLAVQKNVKCENPGTLNKRTLTLSPFFYEHAEALRWDPGEIDEKNTPAGASDDTQNFFRFVAAYTPKETQTCVLQLANAIHQGKGKDVRVKKGKSS